MRDIVVASIFVPMAVMAFSRPWVGILLWTWVSFMNPHRLCYGFMASMPVALIGGSIALLSFLLFQRPKRMIWRLETVLLLLFMLWVTLTTVFSLNSADAWTYWEQVMKIDLMVVLTVIVMQEPRYIKATVWTIVLSLGYFGLKGGLFTLGGSGNRVWGPPGSFIEDNNDLGVALAMTLPLMRYIAVSTEKRWIRVSTNILTATTVLAILGTYSRAAFLALCATGLSMWWKSKHKLTTAVLIAAIGFVGAKTMPQSWFDRIHSIDNYESDGSAQQRFDSWHIAWRLAMDRPVTGGGFRTMSPELFRRYSDHPDWTFHEVHSIYMKMLAEHGFPGLFLFVILFIVSWQRAGKYAKWTRDVPDLQWAGELLRALQVSFIAYLVGGAFGPMCYFDLPYTLLAIVALCGEHIRNALSNEDEEAHIIGSETLQISEAVA